MRKLSQLLLLLVTLLVSFFPLNVNCFKEGAGDAACSTMTPVHSKDGQVAQTQTSDSPYQITLNRTALQGYEAVKITLSSKNGDDIFKGFLIQVRKPGGDTAVGEFSKKEVDPNSRMLKCFEREGTAMTHNSNIEKKSVTVEWVAPNDSDAEYQVYYSVVGTSSQTFWSSIPHPEKLRVTRNAQATTTAAAIKTANQGQLDLWREVYGGCGKSKGCFGIPGKCLENYDATSNNPKVCDVIVTWSKTDGKNKFQLSGTYGSGEKGYVAVGISKDDLMGEDSVVGCALDGTTVSAKRYTNNGKHNRLHPKEDLGISNKIKVANVDGQLYCSFEQADHSIDSLDIRFDSNKYYYLLSWASGLGKLGLSKHEGNSKASSPHTIAITDYISIGASSNTWLVQLHGTLMLFAWLPFASTGMITARFYKQTYMDYLPLGRLFWFTAHLICMYSTACLTLLGAIFIMIKKKGVDISGLHPLFGIIVIALTICQIGIALFRPLGGKWKPVFSWVHWGLANMAHVFAIICIFLAWELGLADLKRFGGAWIWTMIGIVLVHVLMHIVMTIFTLWSDHQLECENKLRAITPGPMRSNGQFSEAPGTTFRTVMLSLYVSLMSAGAITLVVLLFW